MYVIGIDGGQTSTLAMIASAEGHVAGTATAGPANHIDEPGGPERCQKALSRVIDGVLSASGIKPERVAGIGMGMTGAQPLMHSIAQNVLAQSRCRAPLAFVHDTETAFRGALGDPTGCIVIAGTGSVALAKDGRGHERRVGGWGYTFGDEGSGWWIGVEMLRAASRQADGRDPKGPLLDEVLGHFQARDMRDLHARVYRGDIDRPSIAGLAAVADGLAARSDRVAGTILEKAGAALAELAAAAVQHVKLPTAEVSYVGGVWRSDRVLHHFTTALSHMLADATVVAPRMPPVGGALLLAYEAAGKALSEPMRDMLVVQLNHLTRST